MIEEYVYFFFYNYNKEKIFWILNGMLEDLLKNIYRLARRGDNNLGQLKIAVGSDCLTEIRELYEAEVIIFNLYIFSNYY